MLILIREQAEFSQRDLAKSTKHRPCIKGDHESAALCERAGRHRDGLCWEMPSGNGWDLNPHAAPRDWQSGDKSQAAGLKAFPAKPQLMPALTETKHTVLFGKCQYSGSSRGWGRNRRKPPEDRGTKQFPAECPEPAGSSAHRLPYRTQHRGIRAHASSPQPGSEIFTLNLANPPLDLRVSILNTLIVVVYTYKTTEPCINRT